MQNVIMLHLFNLSFLKGLSKQTELNVNAPSAPEEKQNADVLLCILSETSRRTEET